MTRTGDVCVGVQVALKYAEELEEYCQLERARRGRGETWRARQVENGRMGVPR